jgi:hypothetical protein
MVTYVGQETVELGVVLERRPSAHPWLEHSWHAVGVIPQAPAADPKAPWRELLRDGEVVQYHAGTLPLSLFRKETDGYRLNLAQEPPRVFVVIRRDEDPQSPHELRPFHVTACAFEAQIYLDNGEDIVEAVTMPEVVAAWVRDFVARNHVEEPFKKRKRRPHVGESRKPFEPPADSPVRTPSPKRGRS